MFLTTKSQVIPIHDGDFRRVLDFVNLHSDADKALFPIYLVTCLLPDVPRPLVILHGEKGAAKSTAMWVMRETIDPAKKPHLDLSRSQQNRAIVLHRNYMPTFDNLDDVTTEQSNDLCRACTGGGISVRELYTTADERILFFKRCVIMNGINVVANRADLLDRSILFELDRIDPCDRKEEAVFQKDFEAAKPEIVGGMFDVLSKAMAIYPTVELKELPRMADFSRWGYAVAEALCIGGKKFLEYYRQNMNTSNLEAISSDHVAAAVMALMETRTEWEGTMTELLKGLEEIALNERIDTHPKYWPQSASALSKRLTLLISNLSDAGISCIKRSSTAKKTKGHSMVTLKKIVSEDAPKGSQPSPKDTYHIAGGVLATSGDTKTTSHPWSCLSEALTQAKSGASSDSGDDLDLFKLV
jgi:hypothetical protein